MSKHTYTTVLIGTVLAASIVFLFSTLANAIANGSTIDLASSISIGIPFVLAALLVAHLRGVPMTAEFLVVMLIAAIIGTISPGIARNGVIISPLVPCVIAAAVLSPRWAFLSFLACLGGALLVIGLRAGAFTSEILGPTVELENILILFIIAVGITVGSSIANGAQRAALRSAETARQERDQVALKSRELATANGQMNDQIEQQRQLLDLVATLETPAVQLADGILFSPVVGHIDTRRAQALTTRLLHEVSEQRARLVILDIGGVAVMDTAVAQALLNTARSLRLLGCDVAISGITAGVAMTLTDLGIALEDIKTVRSPQEALTLFANGEKSLKSRTAFV